MDCFFNKENYCCRLKVIVTEKIITRLIKLRMCVCMCFGGGGRRKERDLLKYLLTESYLLYL